MTLVIIWFVCAILTLMISIKLDADDGVPTGTLTWREVFGISLSLILLWWLLALLMAVATYDQWRWGR